MEVKNNYIEIENILNEKLKEFSDSEKNLPKIAEYEKEIKNLTHRIDELFESTSVVGEMYTQESINEYISDMDDRYAKNIPPGFCDAGKNEEKIFGDLVIPNKAGDHILWKDLINLLQVDEEKKINFLKL